MLTDSKKGELFAQLFEIYGELAVFASHLTGWEEDNGPRYLPTGASSFDLMHSAVVRLASGDRSSASGVGLVNTLKAIIRSGHSNLWHSGPAQEVSLDAPRSSDQAERPEDDGPRTYGDTLATPFPNPEQALLAKEHDAILNAQLEEALSGDVEGLAVVAAILDGADAPKEIAADTGLPVERVKVIRRRLQRSLKVLARQWRGGDRAPASGSDQTAKLAVRRRPPRAPRLNRSPPEEAPARRAPERRPPSEGETYASRR